MHCTPQQPGRSPTDAAAVYSSSTQHELSYSRYGTQIESVGSTGGDAARQDTPVPFAALPPSSSAAAHNGLQHHVDSRGQRAQWQPDVHPGEAVVYHPYSVPAEDVEAFRPAVLQYGAEGGSLAAPRTAAAVSLGGGSSPGGSNSSGDTLTAAAAGRPPAAPRRQPFAGAAASLYRADSSSVMKVMAALQAGRLLPPSAMGAPAASSAAGRAAESAGPLHQSRPRLPLLTVQPLQSSSRLLNYASAPAVASASTSSSSSRASGGWPLAARASTEGLTSNQLSRAAAILATHPGPVGSSYPFRARGAGPSRQHTQPAVVPDAAKELYSCSSHQPDAISKQPAASGVDQQWWQPLSTAAAAAAATTTGAAGGHLHTSHGPWWRDPLPFRPNAASEEQQAQALAEDEVLQGSPLHYLGTTAAALGRGGTAAAGASALYVPAGDCNVSAAHHSSIFSPPGLLQRQDRLVVQQMDVLPPAPHPQHSKPQDGSSVHQLSALQLLSRAYQQPPGSRPSPVVTTGLQLPAARGRPMPASDSKHSSMACSSGSHGISSSSTYTAEASDLSTSTWVAPSAAGKTAGVRLAARGVPVPVPVPVPQTSAPGLCLPLSLDAPPLPAPPATKRGYSGLHLQHAALCSSTRPPACAQSCAALQEPLGSGDLQAMVDAVLGPLRHLADDSSRHVAAKVEEEARHSTYMQQALHPRHRHQMTESTAGGGCTGIGSSGYWYSQQVAAGVWEEPGGLRQKYGRPASQQSNSSRASSSDGSGSEGDCQQLEQAQLQCQQDLSDAMDLALGALGAMSVSDTSAAIPHPSIPIDPSQQQLDQSGDWEEHLRHLTHIVEVLQAEKEWQQRQRRSSSRGGSLAPPRRSYDVAPYPSYTSCATTAAAAAGGRGASGAAAATTTSLTSASVCQRPASASSSTSTEDEVADTAQSRHRAAAMAACLTRETPPGRSAGPAPSHATHLRWRHQQQEREAQEAAVQGLGRVYGREGAKGLPAGQPAGSSAAPVQPPAARRRLVWGVELPQRAL